MQKSAMDYKPNRVDDGQRDGITNRVDDGQEGAAIFLRRAVSIAIIFSKLVWISQC